MRSSRAARTARTARRTAAVLAAVAAAATTTAGPASAQGLVDDDRGADVWSSTTAGPPWQHDSRRVNVAVTRFEARHSDTALVFDLDMRDLRRGGGYFFPRIAIRTGGGEKYSAGFTYDSDGSRTQEEFFTDGADRSLPCEGLRHSLSFREDTLRVRVPRSCVGDPARVRVGGHVLSYPAGSDRVHVDRLLTAGIDTVWSGYLRRG